MRSLWLFSIFVSNPMHLTIQTWSDNQILRNLSSIVTPHELHKYRVLGESMCVYIRNPKHRGIGLAAPQVGVNKRIIVVWLPKKRDDESFPVVLMINPIILDKSPKTDVDEEGCLSLPGILWDVTRSTSIELEWIDLKGKKMRKNIQGFWARVIQHEIDHLDGILISDKFLK